MLEAKSQATAGAGADPGGRAGQLMRRASYASVSVAIFLIVLKFGAWMATDSVSMLSTLIDSLLDFVASLLTLFAIRHSLVPADREHRFGHGKAEALGALGQSTFVAGSSVLLLFEAARRFLHLQPMENTDAAIIVMVVSILATFGLVRYQRMVIAETGSVAVGADSIHYLSDLMVNGGVIAALALTHYLGWLAIDPLVGAIIAIYILWTAWRIARTALDMLMDRELPDAARQRIRELALKHPEVRAIHELKTRASGQTTFIQFHLEMDANLTLIQAHAIADAVETQILEVYPDAEVLIHEDPEGVEERRKVFA